MEICFCNIDGNLVEMVFNCFPIMLVLWICNILVFGFMLDYMIYLRSMLFNYRIFTKVSIECLLVSASTIQWLDIILTDLPSVFNSTDELVVILLACNDGACHCDSVSGSCLHDSNVHAGGNLIRIFLTCLDLC